MERRMGKIIIHASGGTAGKGSNTCKLTLPSVWMKAMGISEDEREVELTFDGSAITVVKRLTLDEFISQKMEKRHSIVRLLYYNRDVLCTTIVADQTEHVLKIENHTDHMVKTAFGNNTAPMWDNLQHFLEERCVPRTRAGLREYLETIGVDEYDPIEIIKKTEGRMAEDDQWIKIEVLS